MVTMSNGLPLSAFLPSYQELFGDFNIQNGDESRSVYSPAAYLADLLELIGDSFEDSPLRDRRPDLAGIPLNGENSYTVLPYLDIVNEVLERRLDKDPDTRLRDLRFPLNLPFSMRTERRKQYLRRFQIAPEELYRQFAVLVDADQVAREYLGLSPDDLDAITVAIAGEPERFAGLTDAARFRQTTTLTAVEVRELLYGNLGPAQHAEATALFVHQGGPCVTLDTDEKHLLYGGKEIPEDWFDRMARFVRLARKLAMPLGDLDLILRSCCDNRLDAQALRRIAAITVLRRGFDLPIDVVCALAAPINTLGLGDEDRPASLHHRIFGTPLTASGDILAELNKPYRQWLARVLPLTEPDIIAIVKRFRARKAPAGPFDRGDANPADLALLHRIGCLTDTLGVAVDELFGVLDALESDPSMLRFPVPIDTVPSGTDCYRMLDAADAGSSLWLMQTLMVVVRWQRAHGLGSDELVRILGGAAAPVTTEDVEEQREVCEQLRREFENVALSASTFVSRRFSERAAGVIHRGLAGHTDGVVSRRDRRLLRLDRAVAQSAAYQALVQLSAITEEDFLGLGLDERRTAKIFANLVFLGYLDGTGELVESQLEAPDLGLATDFGELRDGVFAAIAELCQAEPASVYPSDVAVAGELTDAQLAELYDNLVFNGYLDADGNVGDPGFFGTLENVEDFEVNADLSTVEQAVLALLRARLDSFRGQRTALDPEIFAGLELAELQQAELLASLRFNGYLDANGYYADKCALAKLPLADFGVALEFYPRRRRILAAMQGQIEAAKSEHNTFAPEDFQQIAEHAVAKRVVELLADGFLVAAHVPEELRPQLADPSPDLWLGADLDETETAMVFHRVATILLEQQAYQLDFNALTELGFLLDESAALVGLLIAEGHLTDELTVPADRLEFFTNVHNALTFTLEGFEDYGKDVFFLLYAVATELTAGIAEITGALTDLAGSQLTTLYTVLQDGFGVPADTLEASCVAVAGSGPNALDVLVAPVLAVEGDVAGAHFRWPTGGSGGSPGSSPSSAWTRPRSASRSRTRISPAPSPNRWRCRPAWTTSTRSSRTPTARCTCSASPVSGPMRPAPTCWRTRSPSR
jgi:hypothetical protein